MTELKHTSHRQLIDDGTGTNVVRSKKWTSFHRGTHTSVQDLEDFVASCDDQGLYAMADPLRLAADREFMSNARADAVLSHVSAWSFHGLPCLRVWSEDARTHVSVPKGTPQIARKTVRCFRRSNTSEFRLYGGMAVTLPAQTWLDLAMLPTRVEQLVALGDAYVGRNMDRVKELRRAVDREKGVAGIRKARQALEDVRPGAESLPESIVRCRMRAGGLPEPAINREVYDDDGRFVARPDLAYGRVRVAVEYEGDHHRTDPAQWMKDIERVRKLEALGWTVIRVTRHYLGFLVGGEGGWYDV